MCYENGGTVDDLLIYKRGEEDYLLVINASNIEKDYEWLASHVIGDATVVNVSSEVAQLAIHTKSRRHFTKVVSEDLKEIKFFKFKTIFL